MIEKNWLDLKKPDEMEIKVSEYNPSQAVVAVGGVLLVNPLQQTKSVILSKMVVEAH